MSNLNKVKCEICGDMIASCGIKNHLRSHKNGTYEKNRKQRYKLDHDDLFCKFCNKECKNKNSLVNHEIRCKENPCRLKNTGNSESLRLYELKHHSTRGKIYADSEKWKTDQHLVCKYCGKDYKSDSRLFDSFYSLKMHETKCRYNTSKTNYDVNKTSSLEKELDDDGKLFTKYVMKKENATHEGLQCLLTFDEWCRLVKEAGLKSSDLGFSGRGYVLARYHDEGDYVYGNCRFITQQENADEKILSEKSIESSSRNMRKFNERLRIDDEFRNKVLTRRYSSEYFQRRHKEFLQKESNKDPRFSGTHNSQYGTRWITNGVENKKLHSEEEMPEGFHFGRVNCNQYRSS